MRLGAAVGILLLTAGPVLAQAAGGWTQVGGDMGHANVGMLSDQPLDVVATFRLDPAPEEFLAPTGIYRTPYGPVGMMVVPVSATTRVCQLFRITDIDAGRVDRFGPTVGCEAGARVLAYDAANDAIIVEIDGAADEPMLQSWDARTGESRWAVGPQIVAEPPGVLDSYDWYLSGFAMDEELGELYVGYTGEGSGRHHLEAVSSADGARRWSTTVPARLFLDIAPAAPATEEAADFEIEQIAATEAGLVVTGLLVRTVVPGVPGQPYPVAAPGQQLPAVAWFDRNGTAVGGAAPATDPLEDPAAIRSPARSPPIALGARGAVLFDGDVLLIDPVNARAQSVPITVDELVTGARPPPAWSNEALVVPLMTTVIVYPAGDTSSPRVWPGLEGSEVRRLLLAPPADAYAIVSRVTKDGAVADLVRIDLASARTIDRLPLPLPSADVDSGINVLPLGDGRMLLWSGAGTAVLLAPAPEHLRPRIELENAFPAAGQEFGLVATVAGQTRAMSVAWGDGVLDRAEPGARLVHAYELPGRRVVRVSALYPDNRTGTAEAIVHVGADPPQELTVIQEAFSPDRQETTFFLLGLAMTAVGGAFALLKRRGRRSRLQTDLEALERIRALGRTDAFAAARELGAFRTRIKRDLAEGTLDDAQYTALSHEAVRLLASLRLRLVGSLQARLGPEFRHLLETALEDGAVTADETAALRAALAAERGISPAERERLDALIAAWSADGQPGAA